MAHRVRSLEVRRIQEDHHSHMSQEPAWWVVYYYYIYVIIIIIVIVVVVVVSVVVVVVVVGVGVGVAVVVVVVAAAAVVVVVVVVVVILCASIPLIGRADRVHAERPFGNRRRSKSVWLFDWASQQLFTELGKTFDPNTLLFENGTLRKQHCWAEARCDLRAQARVPPWGQCPGEEFRVGYLC